MCQGGKPDAGKFHSSYIGMNVCGSAYENGCVVDGMCTTAVHGLIFMYICLMPVQWNAFPRQCYAKLCIHHGDLYMKKSTILH